MVDREYIWRVVYVTRHHEKRVGERLSRLDVEVILPLTTVRRQRSDRIVTLEEPLFPSYVFVKISCREYLKVLADPAVVSFISYGGRPTRVPDREIEILKRISTSSQKVECSSEQFHPGEKVTIEYGPFAGLSGELLSVSRGGRFRLGIDCIGYSIVVSLSPDGVLSSC